MASSTARLIVFRVWTIGNAYVREDFTGAVMLV
jgi:hypothetical protein